MTLFNISEETAARFPELAKEYADARAVLAEAEAHYGYMRTMSAEDGYIAAARGGSSLDIYDRLQEARGQYRTDCAAAHAEYKTALQAKTDAYIAVLNAEREAAEPEAKAA